MLRAQLCEASIAEQLFRHVLARQRGSGLLYAGIEYDRSTQTALGAAGLGIRVAGGDLAENRTHHRCPGIGKKHHCAAFDSAFFEKLAFAGRSLERNDGKWN